ncbi:divergent polysaccharide deacetylase family protein [Fulvimarina pelagi]|uniref:divergent polysaccharide deacetylase family protein n=1 Tax=Fulvimarina pelagi TaxID=217511 RepID=UPI001650E662|nr:divergent polysaccharide deacetylase family protein [Fulvimarina pelagi]
MAVILIALSLYPAWFDRIDRHPSDASGTVELAGIDQVATGGISSVRGTAKQIDIDAALNERARRETTELPYQPANMEVRDLGDMRQAISVAHMPDDAFIEDSEYGLLPVRAVDGRRPFDVYRGASPSRMGPRVAIVVGGLGISQSGTLSAIRNLPSEVTLAFAANGNSLARWMQEARRGGHELLLQMPMEPVGYPTNDPGDNTVTSEQMNAEDFSSVLASLGQMTNYVGVMNYLGGQLTSDASALHPFMSELARRGLMYLDDGSSARSVAVDLAETTSIPAGAADLVLDDVQDAGEISRRLDQLEQIARTRGHAIGVASAFETTTSVIGSWIREAERRGITVTPVSSVVRDPEGR